MSKSKLVRRAILRASKIVSVALLIAISFSIAITVCLLSFESSRTWLTHVAIDKVNHYSKLNISVTGLSIPHLGEWRAQNITVRKEGSLWVVLDSMDLSWKPRSILAATFVVNHIRAETLTLYKVKSEPPPLNIPEQDDKEIKLPNLKVSEMSINAVHLRGFEIEKSVAGNLDFSLKLKAKKTLLEPLTADINIRLLSEPTTKIKLSFRAKSLIKISLSGEVTEAPGGILGRLAKLPTPQAINLDFTALLSERPNDYSLQLQQAKLSFASRDFMTKGNLTIEKDTANILLENLTVIVDDTHHVLNASKIGDTIDAELDLNKFPIDLLNIWQDSFEDGELSGKISIHTQGHTLTGQGKLFAETTYRGLPLKLDVDAVANPKSATINAFKLKFSDAEITAKGDLDREANKSLVYLTAKNIDLNLLTAFNISIPEKLSAKVITAKAKLYGPLNNLDGDLEFLTQGDYDSEGFSSVNHWIKKKSIVSITQSHFEIGGASLDIEGKLNPWSLDGNLNLVAHDLPLDLLNLAGVDLPEGLSGKINTQVTMSDKITNPNINGNATLSGKVQTIPFILDVNVAYKDLHATLKSLSLSSFGEEVFNAKGDYHSGTFSLDLSANKLPSDIIRELGWQFKPGGFNAKLHAHGTLNEPILNGNVVYDSFLKGGKQFGEDNNIPFKWNIDLETKQGVFAVESTFKRDAEKAQRLNLRIPLQPYRDYLLTKKNPSTIQHIPTEASLLGTIDLDSLSFLLDEGLHKLGGTIVTDINVHGSVAQPILKGTIQTNEIHYENVISGTTIEHLNCLITGQQMNLNIDFCEATDGNTGKYSLTGSADLPPPNSSGRVDVKLKVEKVSLIKMPNIESEASGEIALKGDFDLLSATGELEVTPLNASFDAPLPNNIPSIEVRDINEEVSDTTEEKQPAIKLPKIEFDISLIATQQAYLRGRGLEAELQGRIDLHGDLNKIHYEGEFKTIRGVVEIFNKKFILDQGQVSFANEAMSLAITATYKKNGQQIQAYISGTNDNLNIKLSATPYMPEDEILGYIILGKSLKAITAFEAVQLASAIQTLRGGGSSFDPIGKTREILGVDNFSVESVTTEAGESGVNVGVGKYINDKVYLELDHTPDPSRPWVGNITIELTPSINLESSTGGSNGIEGAELKWKRDY